MSPLPILNPVYRPAMNCEFTILSDTNGSPETIQTTAPSLSPAPTAARVDDSPRHDPAEARNMENNDNLRTPHNSSTGAIADGYFGVDFNNEANHGEGEGDGDGDAEDGDRSPSPVLRPNPRSITSIVSRYEIVSDSTVDQTTPPSPSPAAAQDDSDTVEAIINTSDHLRTPDISSSAIASPDRRLISRSISLYNFPFDTPNTENNGYGGKGDRRSLVWRPTGRRGRMSMEYISGYLHYLDGVNAVNARGNAGANAGENGVSTRRRARLRRRLSAPWRHNFIDDEDHTDFFELQLRVQSRYIFAPSSISFGFLRDRVVFQFLLWSSSLTLENSAIAAIAFVIMQRRLAVTPMSTHSMERAQSCWRRLMAASFWVAAKFCDSTGRIPPAWRMAAIANVTVLGLIDSELSLLVSLKWCPVPMAMLPGILGTSKRSGI
ncbi:unnamed protein product [Calypogeia fissa]